MSVKIPEFQSVKEKIDFLVKNKEVLKNQKKSAIKRGDSIITAISCGPSGLKLSNKTSKEDSLVSSEMNEDVLLVKAVINTTWLMDSHDDVHADGLWTKSLKENKRIMHVQEHKTNEFDKIISSGSDLKASVKKYTWKELGYDIEGETEALLFESKVRKDRNVFMHNQYKNNWVDNHSVGMQYVKLFLAVNDKDYKEEKSLWDANIDKVANKEDAVDRGYFWLVTEAKVIEGSAVPNGSNWITPTDSVSSSSDKEEEEVP